MKKNYAFSILIILQTAFTSFGQSSSACAEKDAIIVKQKQELANKLDLIEKLEKDIVYYKETLHLLSSEPILAYNGITFRITAIKGDTTNGKVLVEGLLTNSGAENFLQSHSAKAFDPQGNGYQVQASYIEIANAVRIDKLYNDVPMKFTVSIAGLQKIPVGTPMIKALEIEFLTENGTKLETISLLFRNLTIDWK